MGVLSSVFGNNDQAVIMIDIRMEKPEKQDSAPPNILTQTKKLVQKVQEMANAVANLLAMQSGGDTTKQKNCERFYFYVQYNPSEILINGEKNIIQVTDVEKKANNEQQQSVQTQTAESRLEFKLIFDEMTITDSFTTESLLSSTSLNPTSIVKGLIGLFMKAKTVSKYTDAFISCIGNKDVDRVIFIWSNFIFVGLFSKMTVNYSMFDKYGNPVRAEVGIVLKQIDSVVDWSKDIDREFSRNFGLLSNLVNGAIDAIKK